MCDLSDSSTSLLEHDVSLIDGMSVVSGGAPPSLKHEMMNSISDSD